MEIITRALFSVSVSILPVIALVKSPHTDSRTARLNHVLCVLKTLLALLSFFMISFHIRISMQVGFQLRRHVIVRESAAAIKSDFFWPTEWCGVNPHTLSMRR